MVASLCCGPAPREMGGMHSPAPEGLSGKWYRNVGKPVFRPGSRFFLLKYCWLDASNGRPREAQQRGIHYSLYSYLSQRAWFYILGHSLGSPFFPSLSHVHARSQMQNVGKVANSNGHVLRALKLQSVQENSARAFCLRSAVCVFCITPMFISAVRPCI